MAGAAATGKADVTDHTHNSTAGGEDSQPLPPCLVELIEKVVIRSDVAELVWTTRVFLQGTVRWAGHHKMDGCVRQNGETPCIASPYAVVRAWDADYLLDA